MGGTATDERKREEVRRLLLSDAEYYAKNAVRIVDKRGEIVPFVYKEPQRRFARALEAQRAAGQPMRGCTLKARQIGFSTQAQSWLMQRTTQIPNHHSRVVAHDLETAGKLFRLGKGIYQRLPEQIKPPRAYENNTQGRQYLNFGTPARQLRERGITGLDSSYSVATAGRKTGGRGATERTLHLSEYAFWEYPDIFDGIAQAVPDDPDTLIIVESTAYGENHFKEFWELCSDNGVNEVGSNGYFAMFTAWFEEPAYRRAFANDIEREEFRLRVGDDRDPHGGEEEQRIVELVRAFWGEWILDSAELDLVVLEHLHWRRWAIKAKVKGSLQKFHQEYPSTPDEAFLSTGRKVFDAEHVDRVRRRVARTDPVSPTAEDRGPARGALANATEKRVVGRDGASFTVPQSVEWVPSSRVDLAKMQFPFWKRWASPVKAHARRIDDGEVQVPDGQYIVSCDPMSGEENEGTLARHSIQVIDHRTRRQVAQYESQLDPDIVAMECLRAALFYNKAWIVVERTGGWGLPILRRIARDWHYPRVWRPEQEDAPMDNPQERLGWSTDTSTKPQLIARGLELLRGERDGIRSHELGQQLGTYVYDDRGRADHQPGKLSDHLMAWLIGQEIASRRPIRPERSKGAISTTGDGGVTMRAR